MFIFLSIVIISLSGTTYLYKNLYYNNKKNNIKRLTKKYDKLGIGVGKTDLLTGHMDDISS